MIKMLRGSPFTLAKWEAAVRRHLLCGGRVGGRAEAGVGEEAFGSRVSGLGVCRERRTKDGRIR